MTLGYWPNKNGNNVITKSLGGLSGLNALLGPLHIVNGAGQTVVPFASLTAFDNWIVGANASNMANMLSAQLAAMDLNVASGGVTAGRSSRRRVREHRARQQVHHSERPDCCLGGLAGPSPDSLSRGSGQGPIRSA